MFIIPADTRYSRGRWPWATTAIIVLNALVFFGLQTGDPQFTGRYVFDPAAPSVTTLFTHMFLHGNTDHLLGNMMALALAGVLVEYALGPVLYTLVYGLGGLCGIGLFWLLHLGEAGGVLGASGAVSGLMAAFAVLYGRRKLRFFYTLLVYFDFITLPAIALLPYWIGWETLQYLMNDGSRIAYEAHLGGLLGGAVLGWLTLSRAQQPLQERQRILEQSEEDARWEQGFADALVLMGRLEFDRARALFTRLGAARPADPRPSRQLFRLARSRPESEGFHRAAVELLSRARGEASRVSWPSEVLDEYLAAAQPAPRLPEALMLELLERFAASGDSPRVDRLLGLLLRGGSRDPRSGIALRQLLPRVPPDKARAYSSLLTRYFSGA